MVALSPYVGAHHVWLAARLFSLVRRHPGPLRHLRIVLIPAPSTVAKASDSDRYRHLAHPYSRRRVLHQYNGPARPPGVRKRSPSHSHGGGQGSCNVSWRVGRPVIHARERGIRIGNHSIWLGGLL